MKTLKYAILTIMMGFQAQAEIREINEMASIISYIKPSTLVVFDLDNTVIEPLQSLGSDQWFDYQLKSMDLDLTIKLWASIQKVSRVRAVEPTTSSLIRGLQEKGYSVIALTARPESVLEASINQLKSVDVRFSEIISIGPGLSKGEALSNYLNRSSKRFKRVVFVDDKRKHVESVDASLRSANIEHYEFRYGAADQRVRSLNPSVVACQLKIFKEMHKLVSDQKCGG